MPGPDDDELCIMAMASEVVEDVGTTAMVLDVVERSGVDGMIESTSHDPLFELDLLRVDVATWVDIGQRGTHAVRHRWTAS